MLRFAVLALFIAASSAASISPSPNGAVVGVVPCGSKGKVLEIRVTDCTTLPCDLTVGKTYAIEVDFIPSVEHTSLTFIGSILANGKENRIVDAEVAVHVVPGTAYTIAYPLLITGAFAQGNVAMRIQVADSGITELCGLARAFIHE